MRRYGELPKRIGCFPLECQEMMFVQYMPIKLAGQTKADMERRFDPFYTITGIAMCDFVGEFGLDRFLDSYVYLTAKHMFQSGGCSFNREGWHCDGFLTDDINYIWTNKNPTVFNTSPFNLTPDDTISMKEMAEQARPENDFRFQIFDLLRLDQYNVHKVGDDDSAGLRTFVKISFSRDKYDLIGNAHNPLLDYSWEMRKRGVERNIPQKLG